MEKISENGERGAAGGNFCGGLVFSIVYGIYLFNVENNNACQPYKEDFSETVDEAQFWTITLQINFVAALVSMVQGLLTNVGLTNIGRALNLNCCLSLAGFIMMHIARFSYTGKVCAGDNVDNAALQPFLDDLDRRGKLFFGCIIATWSLVGCAFVVMCIACLCGARS